MSDSFKNLKQSWVSERHNQIKREYKRGVPIKELNERFTKEVVKYALKGV